MVLAPTLFPKASGICSGYTALTDRIPSITCVKSDSDLPSRPFQPLLSLLHMNSCNTDHAQHSLLEV